MPIRSLAAAPTAAIAPRERRLPATGPDAGHRREAAARVVALHRGGRAGGLETAVHQGTVSAPRAPSTAGEAAGRRRAGAAAAILAACHRLLGRRRQAAEARSLAALDARTLRDLGIEPDAVHRELRGRDGGR